MLDFLLERGYDVVFTVRVEAQGYEILGRYPQHAGQTLAHAVVEDITSEAALTEVLKTNGPFDSVLHTASPFTTDFRDPVRDVLDPAIKGTTTILKVIADHAPSVKRVVVTSSFAAIVNHGGNVKTYNETSWNPITWDQAVQNHRMTYAASKTLAEKAAWEFVETQKPRFDLVTINPPLVFGPVKTPKPNLQKVNTSNQRILDMVRGTFADRPLPPTGVFIWVDVRDVAKLHVSALETPGAGGQRLLAAAGYFSNKALVDTIYKTHEAFRSKLPANPVDDTPPDVYGFDNRKALAVLGGEFRTLVDCVKDTVDSMTGENI